MGMSVSAASAIMFTTFVILFAVVFGAIDNFQNSVTNAQHQNLDREQEIRDMAIELVSVNDSTDQIILLNTGSTMINLEDVDILLNGTYLDRSVYSVQVDGAPSTNLWAPLERLNIQSSTDLDGMRMKIIVNGWASAYYME